MQKFPARSTTRTIALPAEAKETCLSSIYPFSKREGFFLLICFMKQSDITHYRHDLEVIRMTAEQVKKDFSFHNIEITFSGNEQTAYSELKAQLTPLLAELFTKDRQRLMQLLYRVDVPERDWKKVLTLNADEQAEKLSGIILEREFMKALTKKLYSQK